MKMKCKNMAATECSIFLWHTKEISRIKFQRELFNGMIIDPSVVIKIDKDDSYDEINVSIGIDGDEKFLKQFQEFEHADVIIDYINNKKKFTAAICDMDVDDFYLRYGNTNINHCMIFDRKLVDENMHNLKTPIILSSDTQSNMMNIVEYQNMLRDIYKESCYTLDISKVRGMEYDEMDPYTNIYILFKK